MNWTYVDGHYSAKSNVGTYIVERDGDAILDGKHAWRVGLRTHFGFTHLGVQPDSRLAMTIADRDLRECGGTAR